MQMRDAIVTNAPVELLFVPVAVGDLALNKARKARAEGG